MGISYVAVDGKFRKSNVSVRGNCARYSMMGLGSRNIEKCCLTAVRRSSRGRKAVQSTLYRKGRDLSGASEAHSRSGTKDEDFQERLCVVSITEVISGLRSYERGTMQHKRLTVTDVYLQPYCTSVNYSPARLVRKTGALADSIPGLVIEAAGSLPGVIRLHRCDRREMSPAPLTLCQADHWTGWMQMKSRCWR